MRNDTPRKPLKSLLSTLPAVCILVAFTLAGLMPPQEAWSDDRDLLSSAGDKPYVFFILDTSDSMRRWPQGTGTHEEWVPANDDDPNSKIYQAKKALYEVIQQAGNNALYGFATFDTFEFDPNDKHFLYTLQTDPSWLSVAPFAGGSATAPWLGPGTPNMAYPRVGHPLIFGRDAKSDVEDPAANRYGGPYDNDHTDGSCDTPEDLDVVMDAWVWDDQDSKADPVHSTDTFALGQLWSFAKLGENGEHDTIQWFRLGGELYRLTWKALTGGQQMGDVPLIVDVVLEHEVDGDCSSVSFDTTWSETLALVPFHTADQDGDPFLVSPTEFFDEHNSDRGYLEGDDYDNKDACGSGPGGGDPLWLESNYDGDNPAYHYDVIADPLNRDPVYNSLDRGDFIPLDWTNPGYTVGNREEILRRLAPSIILGEAPDFRQARYFDGTYEDRVGGSLQLKADFVDYPPIQVGDYTPLAGSLFRFREWFDNWLPVAMAEDPGWDCRAGVHVILLTDGEERCTDDYDSPPADFCSEGPSLIGETTGDTFDCQFDADEVAAYQAQALREGFHPATAEARGVKTYVLGFDVDGATSLNRMADGGGTCSDRNGDTFTDPDTECAYFANSKDELVEALLAIFSDIRAEPRSFVPAASPPRSFNADPKIVLSNFVPVPGQSTWDAHLNAFKRPLPLTSDGRPNTGRVCNGTTITDACFLWDAGEQLEAQAPTSVEVAPEPPDLSLGAAADQRRVFYGLERDIVNPENVPRVRRLFEWTSPFDPTLAVWGDLTAGMGLLPVEIDRAKEVIRETLQIKEATIVDSETGLDVDIEYILGDIFHSDPAVVGPPNEGRYFAADLYSTDPFDCTDNTGYRCYYEKHQYRRQVLVFGANDGQVHAVDLGTFDYTTDPDEDGQYNDGTGRELFSYIPRGVLPNVLAQAESTEHDWDVDSPIRVSDVFIDPEHDGFPVADEREWRTVAIGGLRRGGNLYYALDMSQPDKLDPKSVGVPINGYVPSCWDEEDTADCGENPYAAALWELTDTWDEDPLLAAGSGYPDLGRTWSVPNTGRIRVLEPDGLGNNEEVDKFVAVFGGGMDPVKAGNQGNWLYMVDIETGRIIYKRRLVGSAASEPAAVDTDQNGYLDTIYIGTLDGYLYKVDTSVPQLLDSTATVTEYSSGGPVVRSVRRIVAPEWDPIVVFDTGGRPIYFPPSVIFVGKRAQFSLAFGTGDREDILVSTGQVARFYNVVDDDFAAGDPRLPLTEADLQTIAHDSPIQQITDLLFDPPLTKQAGWVLTLTDNERVVTNSLAFSGVVTFSTFIPDLAIPGACGGVGSGRTYILNATNADALADEAGVPTRFKAVDDFLTNAYVESGGLPGDDDDDDDDDNNQNPCAGLQTLAETLKTLFPPRCNFANRTENIMTQRSNTEVECIAPVPVCIEDQNWKEF
jgi:hypothetical protein